MNETDLSQQSSVDPVVACATLLAAALILFLPRRQIIVPVLFGGILIPMDQVLVLGPLHFPMIRVLVLAGWVRVLVTNFASRRHFPKVKMNTLDKLVILYAVFDFIDYVALWDFSAQAFINRCGALLMVAGIYFLLRVLISNEEEVVFAIKIFACVSAVIALVMLVEHVTGQNPYSHLGGSRAWTREALMVRDAKIRAMGPFQHPILAGSFGAITLPLFLGLWIKKQRLCAAIGMLSATIIVLMSASSTPMMAYAFSLIAMGFWVLRNYLRIVRWGLALSLLTLHLVMKAPVWALIQRVDVVGGSSGFHRYNLVDQTIRHFGEWWLFGIKDTSSWGPDLWDHANQYVAVGTNSGVLPLIFFLAIIVYGFKGVGVARRQQSTDKASRFVWALGAGILANVVAFFGISYVDQIILGWWGVLAMVQALAAPCIKAKKFPDSTSVNFRPHASPRLGKNSPIASGVGSCLISQDLLSNA